MRGLGGTIAALAAAGALALPASAAAVTDDIRAENSSSFFGGTGLGGSFQLDAGDVPTFFNDDPGVPHNVVAKEDGPDGKKLFGKAAEFIDGVDQEPVLGAQYLSARAQPYEFVCTIHSEMQGQLQVVGSVNGPVKRPKVDLAIRSAKLKPVRRTGDLKVSVKAINRSDDVALKAKLGRKLLAKKSNVDVPAGQTKRLTLKLTRAGKRALKNKDQATIKLGGSVPYGKPDKTSRTLK